MGAVANWVYDHSPKPVRDWLDSRGIDRMAEQEYERYLQRKEAGTDTTLDSWNFGAPAAKDPIHTIQYAAEEESIWGDRRKYNIEHDIPLTSDQRKQQDSIERNVPPGAVYVGKEDSMANRDQERKQERDLATNQWERRISQGTAARTEDKKVEVASPAKRTDEEKERSGPER